MNKNISKVVGKEIRNFNPVEITNTTEQNTSLKVLRLISKIETRNIHTLKNKQGHVINEQYEILNVIEEYY